MESLKNLKSSGLVSIKLTGALGSTPSESIDEAINLALEFNVIVNLESNGDRYEIDPFKIREYIIDNCKLNKK